MKILLYLPVLSVCLPVGRCQNGCTISISPSKVKVNSTTADISWESSPQCGSGASSKIESYQVSYQHQGFLACDDNRKDNSSRGSQKVLVNRRFLYGLQPYSKYNITISGIGKKINVKTDYIINTEAALPQTRPRKGEYVAISDQFLKFFWDDPDTEECWRQNGRINGYNVTLMGTESWANGQVPLQERHTLGKWLQVPNLQPYTSYLLKVSINIYENLVNPNVFLEIYGKTRETTPGPPTNILVTLNSAHSVHLKWYPAYPPTGFITKYEIRQGEYHGDSSNPAWTKAHIVELKKANSFLCAGQARVSRMANCYVVDNLKANTSYAFQINTWNNNTGEKPPNSQFSETVWITTPSENKTILPLETTTTKPLPIPVHTIKKDDLKSVGTNSMITILCLAAGVVLLVVIVTAMVYKLKVVKLTQQLSQTQLENRRDSGLSSTYNPHSTTSTHMSDTSYLASVRTTASSIQSRRLPEPPPEDPIKLNPEYSEAYEMPSYLSMAATLPRSHSPRVIEEELEEEQSNIDGYLRPTFPPTESSPMRTPSRQASRRSRQASQEADSDYVSEGEKNPSLNAIPPDSYVAPETMVRQNSYIPPQSYVAPGQLSQWVDDRQYLRSNSMKDQYFNKMGSNSSSKSHSPSTPLILSDIVATEV